MPLFRQDIDTKEIMCSQVFLAWCGCEGIRTKINDRLRIAGVEPSSVPFSKTTGNRILKQYIQQEQLDQIQPSLGKAKHSVLINPRTGTSINLLEYGNNAKRQQTIEGIKEVYNG